jgi:DnaJ-class molecular chaperone
VFTLRGEGMPRASDPSRRGDLHIRVQVAFPSGLGRLTDAQRAALRAALQGCDG